MSNGTSPIILSHPTPYSDYAAVAMCFVTVVVSCFSFLLINRWKLKDEKFRLVLYISSGATLIIGVLWIFELLLKLFGFKLFPIYWAIRYTRFWFSGIVQSLMLSLYFILAFILIGKLSMSQVTVSRLIWLSVLSSSLDTFGDVYQIVRYNVYLGNGQYSIDTLNYDLLCDPVILAIGGIVSATTLLTIIFITSSYFYIMFYVKSRPGLQRNILVRSTLLMLRRLVPIFLVYLLPHLIAYIISFLESTFPNSGIYQSETCILIQNISFYFHWTSVSFLPILVKWSIQPPPPGPLQRIWHSHILPSVYHTQTLPSQIPLSNFNRGVLKIVQLPVPSASSVSTHLQFNPESAARPHGASVPPTLHSIVNIEERVEDGDSILFESNDDVIARMERAVAIFLGFASSPIGGESIPNDVVVPEITAPLPPRHIDAMFGHQLTAEQLDFGALEGVLGREEEGTIPGFGFGFNFGFDRRLGRDQDEEGRAEREDRDMFEMNSMYNRDGKNLIPEGLL